MLITFEQFKKVFESTEKMPKNKNEYMKKLFFYYQTGRKNQKEQVEYNFKRFLRNNIL